MAVIRNPRTMAPCCRNTMMSLRKYCLVVWKTLHCKQMDEWWKHWQRSRRQWRAFFLTTCPRFRPCLQSWYTWTYNHKTWYFTRPTTRNHPAILLVIFTCPRFWTGKMPRWRIHAWKCYCCVAKYAPIGRKPMPCGHSFENIHQEILVRWNHGCNWNASIASSRCCCNPWIYWMEGGILGRRKMIYGESCRENFIDGRSWIQVTRLFMTVKCDTAWFSPEKGGTQKKLWVLLDGSLHRYTFLLGAFLIVRYHPLIGGIAQACISVKHTEAPEAPTVSFCALCPQPL